VDRVIQTFRGAYTREDAPRATPNHLEASFKSNKRESKNEDASSALEMNLAALSLKWLSLTPQSCSHSSPSSNQLKIISRRDWGGVVNAFGGVCLTLGQQEMKKGLRGYKYPSPKN
jgi:hypothetical protein